MSALEDIIKGIVAAEGSISLAAYMELALQHPEYGYYRVGQPFGRTGDFITAPEISQMFGEMLGVWCAEAWRNLRCPNRFALVELGPGRGTMMQDILRSTKNVGGFHKAKELYLLDSNAALRRILQEKLGAFRPQFIEDIADVSPMPMLIVANEFFDSLPVRQFEKTFKGWTERMVAVEGDSLAMVSRPLSDAEQSFIPETLREALPGTFFEFCPKALDLMRLLSRRLVEQKGTMLMIDYGYTASSGTPTVQAVSHHAFADILERPGEVDLTAHVDFTALADVARAAGCAVSAVMAQGEFLKNCGIEIRTDVLRKRATEAQAGEIEAALHRLTDEGQMGVLFKVMEIKG